MLLLSEVALSQAKLFIPHIEADIGVVTIPIEADGLDEIGSFTLEITYDTDVLQFIEFNDNHFTTSDSEYFLYNIIDNRIKLIWFDIIPKSVGNELMAIKFNYLGGSSELNFTGTNEMTTETAEVIDVQYVDGSITQIISGVNNDDDVPGKFQLAQNYPNPFNPSTTIKFGLPQASDVTVKIFDILGQEVRILVNRNMTAGFHTVNFDASNLMSGMYIYRIQANGVDGKDFTDVKKMLLVK